METHLSPTTIREALVNAVVDCFYSVLYSLDLAAADALMANDATVWHNYDAIDQPKADALAAVYAGLSEASDIEYEVLHRYSIPEGCMQQTYLKFTPKGGAALSVHMAHRIVIENGLIVHIDEYVAIPPM
jgi:ketosteroid isomerase-like protein